MDKEMNEALKDKIIIAAISEMEEHGIADFSLRRVASKCNASCAAPYRHFRNKEEIICAVFRFIDDKWKLIEDEIVRIYRGDTKKALIETCMANILFRNANPSYGTVLGFLESEAGKTPFTFVKIKELCSEYCRENGLTEKDAEKKCFALRSFIYGSTLMLRSGELENTEENISFIRSMIEEAI